MKTAAPVLLTLFMVTLIMPVSVDFLGLRLTPFRVLLLLSFIPAAVHVFSGRSGKVMAADIMMSLFAAWVVITFLLNNGISRLPYASITAVELLGGYLLGRMLIRSFLDYRKLILMHLGLLAFLFPFSVIDSLTGRQIWTQILDVFGDVTFRGRSSAPRFGLNRVLNGFDHPILYGLFCSMAVANVVYIFRRRIALALGGMGFVVAMTFLSLSSGALLSAMIQIYTMIWGWLTKGRWKLLVAIVAALYVFLSIASNRGPVIIFIETLTFSQGTAWTRVIQWTYGSAEVMRNPIFGKGLAGGWERPSWLHTSSIDNYWLVVAFRHGLPGFGFLALAIALTMRSVLRADGISEDARAARTGWTIALVGAVFTLATVHIWDAVSVYVFFYIGAGAWIAQAALSPLGVGDTLAGTTPVASHDTLNDVLKGKRPHTTRSRPLGNRAERSENSNPSPSESSRLPYTRFAPRTRQER